MDRFSINPVNLIQALSMALELAVGGVNTHLWRTAVICRFIANEMGIRLTDQQPLLYAALMHDIGAAPYISEWEKLRDIADMHRWGKELFDHAEAGYRLLDDSVYFNNIALFVRHHHDDWDGRNTSGRTGDDIPLFSRIILVADRVEVAINKEKPILFQRDRICDFIASESGRSFDPDVVEVFMRCARKEVFWLDLGNPGYYVRFFAGLKAQGQTQFTIEEVLNIAEMYATIIDRMSIFTATHSRSVSRVAVLLASHHGFCENELKMIRVAGLLHDIGKLSIPNEILEKPGKLTDHEMMIVRQHTYYTYRVLQQIDNFDLIAQWAAFHHETLDGEGYPFKVEGPSLTLGSRIMAVADIFVALAENRPYRKRMGRPDIEKIMTDMAKNGKIDRRIVDTLFDYYQDADNIVLEIHAMENAYRAS